MNSQTRHPFENCKHKNGSLCEKKNWAEEHMALISLGFSYLKLLVGAPYCYWYFRLLFTDFLRLWFQASYVLSRLSF